MKPLGHALSVVGLSRPARRRGFCPACRLVLGPSDQRQEQVEPLPPALTVLAFLVVAGLAWALVLWQSRASGEMAMGLGSFQSFAVSWFVMMAAMMLPSAMPVVFEFAQTYEGRRGWQAATVVLVLTYLSIWLAFGLLGYMVRNAFPMSWPSQGLIGGAAFVLAGLYGLTPIKRASEARCRELCALHGPLPFNLMRSAIVVGIKYSLSCLGCSAALMVAMLIIGMSNVGWAVILSGVLLIYKLAPAPGMRRTLLLSAALGALGVVYGLTI